MAQQAQFYRGWTREPSDHITAINYAIVTFISEVNDGETFINLDKLRMVVHRAQWRLGTRFRQGQEVEDALKACPLIYYDFDFNYETQLIWSYPVRHRSFDLAANPFDKPEKPASKLFREASGNPRMDCLVGAMEERLDHAVRNPTQLRTLSWPEVRFAYRSKAELNPESQRLHDLVANQDEPFKDIKTLEDAFAYLCFEDEDNFPGVKMWPAGVALGQIDEHGVFVDLQEVSGRKIPSFKDELLEACPDLLEIKDRKYVAADIRGRVRSAARYEGVRLSDLEIVKMLNSASDKTIFVAGMPKLFIVNVKEPCPQTMSFFNDVWDVDFFAADPAVSNYFEPMPYWQRKLVRANLKQLDEAEKSNAEPAKALAE